MVHHPVCIGSSGESKLAVFAIHGVPENAVHPRNDGGPRILPRTSHFPRIHGHFHNLAGLPDYFIQHRPVEGASRDPVAGAFFAFDVCFNGSPSIFHIFQRRLTLSVQGICVTHSVIDELLHVISGDYVDVLVNECLKILHASSTSMLKLLEVVAVSMRCVGCRGGCRSCLKKAN